MLFRSLAIPALAWLCLAGPFTAPARAQASPEATQEAEAAFGPADLAEPEQLHRDLTLGLLAQAKDEGWRNLVASRLGPDQTRAGLTDLITEWAERSPTPEHLRFAARLRELDQALRQRMGIETTARWVLGLELVWPGGRHGSLDWSQALFAVRPRAVNPVPAWIEAYGLDGRAVRLDPRQRPGVPVFLAGIDRREAVRAGVEVVNQGLRQAGFATHHPVTPATAPVDCAKLTSIDVWDDEESWWFWGLDTYALVSGVDPVEAKPNIRLVQLPYLRQKGDRYQPDQVLLFWPDYRFSAANIQFWDHGSGTNYKDLLASLLKAAAVAMAGAGLPVYAWIPALADAIIQAMPTSWFLDSDTLLDTFYTLEKGKTYHDLLGAGRTVRISLEPWVLQP